MPSAEALICCECDEPYPRRPGGGVQSKYCPRCYRYFVRPKAARPRPTHWACQRCGFEFVSPDGRHPRHCSECHPVVKAEAKTRSYAKRGHTPRTKAMQRYRRRMRQAGYPDARSITPEQWVQRWNERPELLEKLIRHLTRSHRKYPGDVRQYLDERGCREMSWEPIAA